jgi:fatty acid desaturase
MQRSLETFKRQDVPSELLKSPTLSQLAKILLLDWAIIISSCLLIFLTHYYFYPLWIMIIAGRLHAFGVITHELSHMNLKNKNWKLRIIEIFSAYIIGTSANAMAYHHIRHHRETLTELDPYYNINKKCSGLMRFWLTFKKGLFFVPFWILRSFVAPFALMIPRLRTFYARVFLQDVSKKDLSYDKEVISCLKEDIPIMILHSFLIFFAFFKFEFLIYTYYWALPISGVFCIYRLLIEHEYNITEGRSVYKLIESTFDHHLHFVDHLFIGPHNIGYHSIHHIHPQVGYHYLPELQKWYLRNCKQYQAKFLRSQKINWRQDLFGGIYQD